MYAYHRPEDGNCSKACSLQACHISGANATPSAIPSRFELYTAVALPIVYMCFNGALHRKNTRVIHGLALPTVFMCQWSPASQKYARAHVRYIHVCVGCWCVCVYSVHVPACVCECISLCALSQAMYVPVYVRMYACMYVCMYQFALDHTASFPLTPSRRPC